MSWQLRETRDLELVAALHGAVFDEPMSAQELRRRAEGKRLHAYTVVRSGQAPAGFAVFLGHGSDVELWQAGVLPQRRPARSW